MTLRNLINKEERYYYHLWFTVFDYNKGDGPAAPYLQSSNPLCGLLRRWNIIKPLCSKLQRN